MYNSILVPIDGSGFGEQAVPVAVAIAGASENGVVTLLNVWNPMWETAMSEMAEPLREIGVWEPVAAKSYLDQIRDRIAQVSKVRVEAVTISGNPVRDALLNYTIESKADLIVMTTHGRTGLSRLWLGSMADAILHHVGISVLLWRPGNRRAQLSFSPHPLFSHVLVPLDGSLGAEAILSRAIRLGSISHACYTLIRVVSPYPTARGTTAWDMEIASEEASIRESDEYLQAVAERLRRQHDDIHVKTYTIANQNPAAAILTAASDYGADLIAITSQTTRTRRMLVGSVADKVIRGYHGALLVVRPF